VILEENLCCAWNVVFSLKKNWVGIGVVVSYCQKTGLMLLFGHMIKSKFGFGHSSQVDCFVVVVVQFLISSSLIQIPA